MRLQTLFLSALAGSVAAAAFAQSPPAEAPPSPPAKAGGQGLSDLTNTVQGLEEQTTSAPTPEPSAPPTAPAPPPAAVATTNAPPLAAEQIAAATRAAARGRELVAIARAGMLATQDMLAHVANPESSGIEGWIAEPQGAAMTVTFFDNQNDGPKTVYRATVLGGRVTGRDTFLGTFRPPLSRGQARLAAARTAVAALEGQACSPAGFNYFVVPPAAAAGPIDVYRISAQSARGRFPAGGHFRSTVSSGGAVTDTHVFASACADIEVSESAAGQTPPPIPLAPAPDPVPTEVHVLLSQMSGRALLFTAGTPPRQWVVAGDRIAEIRDGTPRFVTGQN